MLHFDNFDDCSEEIKKLFKFIKDNNVKNLKSLIKNNNISVEELKYDKDILIYSIINDSSLEIIKYIISLYEDLNYSVNCECTINRSKSNSGSSISSRSSIRKKYLTNLTPLCLAIIMERFDISDLLISSGANINKKINYYDYNYSLSGYYGDYYVFDYLLKENLLTPNKLKYILDKNSKIGHLTCPRSDEIFYDKVLFKWIESSDNELLDTLFEHYIMKHINEEKFSFILKKYLKLYLCAIENENYDAIEVLIKHDIRRKNKEDTLNEVINLFYVDIDDHYEEISYFSKNPENNEKSEEKSRNLLIP